MNDKEIINKAIIFWGNDLQKIIAIEECSELIQALTKDLRNYSDKKYIYNIAEEIADVKICIEMLINIYLKINPNFDVLINDNKNFKMYSLKNRLKEFEDD